MQQSVDALEVLFGEFSLHLRWDIESAKTHFQNALFLNPNSVNARFRYSEILILLNRFSDASGHLDYFLKIDPLSLLTYKRVARMLYYMGKFEQSEIYLLDALEMEPNDFEALVLLGGVLTELNRFDDALSVFKKSLASEYNTETISMIGFIYALQGSINDTLEVIEEIKSESVANDIKYEIKLARIYVALNENDTAIKYLYKAFEQRELDLKGLTYDPRWNRLHNEPRFKELVSMVGLAKTGKQN